MKRLSAMVFLVVFSLSVTACGGEDPEEVGQELANFATSSDASVVPDQEIPADEIQPVDTAPVDDEHQSDGNEESTDTVSELCTSELRSAIENGDLSTLTPGVDLQGCDLSELDLSFLDLSGANLEGANFYRTKLDQTDLSGANLERAILWPLPSDAYDSVLFDDANLKGSLIQTSEIKDLTENHGLFSAANLGDAMIFLLSKNAPAELFSGETFFFCGSDQPCTADGTAYTSDMGLNDFCIIDDAASGVKYCYENGLIINHMGWSPDGQTLVVGAASEADTSMPSEEWEFSLVVADRARQAFFEYPIPYYESGGNTQTRKSVAWNQDGSKFAIHNKGVLHIHAATDFEEIQSFPTRVASAWSIAWNSDGTQIAITGSSSSGSGACQTRIWDAANGDLIHTLAPEADGCIRDMAWSPNGETFVTTAGKEGVQFWDPVSFERIGTITTPQQIIEFWGEFSYGWADFTSDGRFLRVENDNINALYIIPSSMFPGT